MGWKPTCTAVQSVLLPGMDHEVTPKDLALAVGGFALRGAYRWIKGVLSDRKNKGLSAQQQEQYQQLLEQLQKQQVQQAEIRTDLSRLKDLLDEMRFTSRKETRSSVSEVLRGITSSRSDVMGELIRAAELDMKQREQEANS